MRIILVRHANPDYSKDCLTMLGHEQAKKAAMRLKCESIDEIYSSSCGRAYETAEYTADMLSKSITKLDFMREIKWGSTTNDQIFSNGHPWFTAKHAVSLGYDLMDESWINTEQFADNIVFSSTQNVAEEADEWLEGLGYRREGANYRVIGKETDKTIALFSHGGSSTALLAHLLNLPFFYLCGIMRIDFTGITVLTLPNEYDSIVSPTFEYINDSRHIKADVVSYKM